MTLVYSNNTLEDVTESLATFARRDISHRTVVIVSHAIHQRRAVATYVRHDREATVVSVPCDDTHPRNLDGAELERVAKRCLQEMDRLDKYGNKGDLEVQPVPAEVADACRRLKSWCSCEVAWTRGMTAQPILEMKA